MNCNTSGKCEDEILQSLIKSDRLYCMESCQNNTLCRFSSYSEAKNQCLLFKTCYKLGFNKNESSFLSSKVSCDLPPGGKYVFQKKYDKLFMNLNDKDGVQYYRNFNILTIIHYEHISSTCKYQSL